VFEILEGANSLPLNRANGEPSAHSAVHTLEQTLQRSSRADLRSVRVLAQAGVIRLSGRVTSFYAKQVAQILVRHECQAGCIENAIEVA
jgi:hypothetical protein